MKQIIKDTNVQRALKALLIEGFMDQSFMGTVGNQLKFLFSWPPNILDESQYANPWSVLNPGGNQAALENISSLVDPIPMWGDIFYPSNNKVESIYRNLILSAQPVRSLKTATGKGAVKSILSDDEFEDLKNQLPVIKPVESERIQSIKSAKEKISSLTEPGVVDTKQIERLEAEVQRPARLKRLVLIAMSEATALPVERVLLYANHLVIRMEKGSIHNPMLTYCPSKIEPLHFVSPADASTYWVDTSFTCLSEENEQLSISLKFTRVDIERPWMVDYLFSMSGWTIQNEKPGWLSNGSPTHNTGLFPLLPISFILCRDFSIKTNTQTLFQVNGLQILTRCCKLMPMMPAE